MAHDEGEFSLLERLLTTSMKQLSRRGFLKGAGTTGLALIAALFGIGKRALAYIPCPPPANGVCDNCYSTCITGGGACSCVCPDCNCEPPTEIAICRWVNNGPLSCILLCQCFGC